MHPGRSAPELVELHRDESGNRRMWTSQRDLYLKRLRDWRRTVRKMARHSVKKVREKMPLRLVALSFVTVCVSISYVQWRMPPKPNPSYIEARRLVEQYELGKGADALDYRHPVYSTAITLLAEVPADSISIDDARDYRDKLGRSISIFERKRREIEAHRAAAEAEKVERLNSLEMAQRVTSGVDKAAVFATECEEELEQFEERMDVLEEMGDR